MVGVGRALLAQEVKETRLSRVTEHLYAVLRIVVGGALVTMPLLAAGYGEIDYGDRGPGSFTFIHGGAALAVATAGVLTLALAGVVPLKTDDQRGTVPFGRELLEALGRGREIPEHRASGAGFFIALEGGTEPASRPRRRRWPSGSAARADEVVLDPRARRQPGRAAAARPGPGRRQHRPVAPCRGAIYAADRAEHVENVIRPALARGAVVITDRYMDSSIAYQGAGRDLAATEVARISRWATGGRLVPDLTVVLDSTRPRPGSGSPRRWTGWSPSRPSSTPGSGPGSSRWRGRSGALPGGRRQCRAGHGDHRDPAPPGP